MAGKESPLLRSISRLLFRSASPSKSVELSPQRAARVREFMQRRYDGLPIDYRGQKVGKHVISETRGWRRVGSHVRSTIVIVGETRDGLVGHLGTQKIELTRLGRLVYRPRRQRGARRLVEGRE